MSVDQAAGWIAPAATMIAAMMTAANLGPRVTGFGFVVFLVGSLAWCAIGMGTHQQNLLWSNGFLSVVNVIGIWRWLGRQAKYQKAGQAAVSKSARARVPTLTSIQALPGSKLLDDAGAPVGVVVDAMMRCSDAGLAYVVVSEGGVGGVGERLHALGPADLEFSEEGVTTRLDASELAGRPVLSPGQWPEALPGSPAASTG